MSSSSESEDAPGYLERRGCLEKLAHATREKAEKHVIRTLRECRSRNPRGSVKLRPYQCEFCGKWHVGHGVRRLK